jgi:hypothetical protein
VIAPAATVKTRRREILLESVMARFPASGGQMESASMMNGFAVRRVDLGQPFQGLPYRVTISRSDYSR